MSLFSLPNELFFHVQSALKAVLIARFVKLHPSTAALYDTLAPAFWRRLCHKSELRARNSDAHASSCDVAVRNAPGLALTRAAKSHSYRKMNVSWLSCAYEPGPDSAAPVGDDTGVPF
ncbi:hypothetical protein PsYK624_158210 [Phanerochaete sordida]|uniref:F-box domain-containing protein n=1 Tax=Phanerochaete sordida TaxID=48140 RepID=A0A9P3GSH8_9APHY|nr:hypothetical protein PsYK624_158210 [Phanerochaete sordida]